MQQKPAPSRSLAALRLGAWVALLWGAVAFLTALGRGPLGVPSTLDGAVWASWVSARDAATIAFAAVRLIALVAGWYLLVVTVAGTAARGVRSARLVALADLLTVPAVRRLLQTALGMGFAAAALTAGPAGRMALPAAAAAAAATEEDTVDMASPGDGAAVDLPVPAPVPAPPAPASRAGVAERVVRPGDSFWSIAEDVVARARGPGVCEAEVARYWERLVQANRSRLADRSNPDLIYPGQTFRLPPTSQGPGAGSG